MIVSGGRREQVAQPVHLAVDPLRRQEAELQLGTLRHETEPRQRIHARADLRRRLEDLLALGHVLAEPAGDLEVVGRLAPRPLDLVVDRARRIEQEQRVGGEQVEQRAAHVDRLSPLARLAPLRPPCPP